MGIQRMFIVMCFRVWDSCLCLALTALSAALMTVMTENWLRIATAFARHAAFITSVT